MNNENENDEKELTSLAEKLESAEKLEYRNEGFPLLPQEKWNTFQEHGFNPRRLTDYAPNGNYPF